jgi:hypothetical protein
VQYDVLDKDSGGAAEVPGVSNPQILVYVDSVLIGSNVFDVVRYRVYRHFHLSPRLWNTANPQGKGSVNVHGVMEDLE